MSIAEEPIAGELVSSSVANMPIRFTVSDEKIIEIREAVVGLTPDTKEGYERIVKAIAGCRTLRVNVEKCRKDLNADSLEWSRRVNAEAKRLTSMLEEIEVPLKTMKQAVDEEKERKKREAEEAARRKVEERVNALAKVNAPFLNPLAIGSWSDEQFESELAKATANYEEACKKAAEEAARKEAEEAAKVEEMRIERERLAAERAELEKLRAEQEAAAKIERERIEAEQAAERQRIAEERAKIEEAQRVERERAEAERAKIEEAQRLEREKLAAEREAMEAEKARIANEQAERERAEREAAEAKERERLAAIAAKELKKRQAALAPDKEKLNMFAASIRCLEVPELTTQEAKDFLENVKSSLLVVAIHCEEFSA